VRIVNASPLIFLARVDCLELLRGPPAAEVAVPDVVFQEVLAGEWFDPNVQAIRLAAATWLRIAPVPQPAPGLVPDRLDAGELAVLSLAIANPGAIVVLDDHAAREEAIRRSIPLLGTAGILLRAKEQGRLTVVRPTLHALRRAGLYLTDPVYRTVLQMAGE
jgi:predicted nucleic acid-binding protein